MSEKLTKQLAKMEKTFSDYKKEFARDGNISRSEAVILKSVSDKLAVLRKKVSDYNASKGIVDFDEPLEVKSEVRSYDDALFKAAFDQSLKDWSQDGNIALNRVKTYFMKTDKPKDLSVSDLLKVASLVFSKNPKAAAVIGTISTIADLVKAAYEASLPSTPSLNEIHSSWATALHNFGGKDHSKVFAQFIVDWKKQQGVGSDVYEVPVANFLPACTKFAATYMPTNSQVEKVFLTEILSKVQDSWDIDSRGSLDQAGVADIQLTHLAGSFSGPSGQLDDVGEQLLQAVKTVWAKERVYALPVQIEFTIKNIMGAELAVIQRSERKAKGTSFKLTSGDQEVFDAFVNTKSYSIPRVSDLRVDS